MDYNGIESNKNLWINSITPKHRGVEKALFHRRISAITDILTLENHHFAATNVIIDSGKIRSRGLTPLGKREGPNNLKLLPRILLFSYRGKKIPLLLCYSLFTLNCPLLLCYSNSFWSVLLVILQLNQRIKFHIISVGTNWHYMPFDRMQWEVPWTARRSNQSILKEINSGW